MMKHSRVLQLGERFMPQRSFRSSWAGWAVAVFVRRRRTRRKGRIRHRDREDKQGFAAMMGLRIGNEVSSIRLVVMKEAESKRRFVLEYLF